MLPVLRHVFLVCMVRVGKDDSPHLVLRQSWRCCFDWQAHREYTDLSTGYEARLMPPGASGEIWLTEEKAWRGYRWGGGLTAGGVRCAIEQEASLSDRR